MGIGAKALGLGMTGLFVVPEIGKISAASKQGKTMKQVLASTVNVAKWTAISALLACANPVGVTACAAIGLAGFVLPGLIPDIDVTEGEKKSYLA